MANGTLHNAEPLERSDALDKVPAFHRERGGVFIQHFVSMFRRRGGGVEIDVGSLDDSVCEVLRGGYLRGGEVLRFVVYPVSVVTG